MKKLRRGLIHIYTGDGKGKTTAALGLAMRAAGAGLRVCFFQFLKKGDFSSGEGRILELLPNNFKFKRFQEEHPIFWKARDRAGRLKKMKELKATVEIDFNEVRAAIDSRRYDLVILDEIINAISGGLIREDDMLELLDTKPRDVELVLTGRGATRTLIERADYASEIRMLKHPYAQGVKARKGIEF